MFVMVKTMIGYFDIVINLKTALNDGEDFNCCVYIDQEEAKTQDREHLSIDKKKLIYGPILFSQVISESKTSGHFTVVSPELISEKSVSLIVKLQKTESTAVKEIQLSTLIKDIYVGVHQFKNVPLKAGVFPFDACQSVVATVESVQLSLVNQLLNLLQNKGNSKEDNVAVKMIIDILLWILSVYNNDLVIERYVDVYIFFKPIIVAPCRIFSSPVLVKLFELDYRGYTCIHIAIIFSHSNPSVFLAFDENIGCLENLFAFVFVFI